MRKKATFAHTSSVGMALLLLSLTLPSRALACVVGTGSGTCTAAALNACLPGGGTVTFNCGGPATITVTSTQTIIADTVIDGGGLITISGGNNVRVFSVNAGVNFTVQNLTIADGNSGTYGGGIFNGAGTLTVINSTFSGNSAGCGSAIYNGGPLTVINSTFSNSNGGLFTGGTCWEGYGAVLYTGDASTVTNSTFFGNGAGVNILNNDFGTLTVTNSTISGDIQGIFNGQNGTLTVTNSTIFGIINGFDAPGGTLTVTNSTFSGAVYAIETQGGTVVVTNATLSGVYGLHNYNSGTVTVTNTIIAGSSASCIGTVTDGGHNIDNGTTCGFTGAGCTNASGSSFCNINPLLDPAGLADNGGPTLTLAIEPNSSAVNAGDESVCSTSTGTAPVANLDQRGFVRPAPGEASCSIGAFEFHSGISCGAGVCYFPLVCVASQCATPTPTPTNTPIVSPTPTPEDSGFVPPDANTGKCEDLVAKHLKTLFGCMMKCQIRQADAARRGATFNEEACEQGTGKPISCRTAYNNATTKLLARNICPPCLNATAQSNLADGVIASIENNNGLTYCAGTVPLP